MPPRPKSNSRRQTLGGVSVNHGGGNRRQTMDPSTSAKRPPRGRKSMIPSVGGRENSIQATPTRAPPSTGKKKSASTGRRRSSVGGGDRRQSLVPPPVPSRVDPRPITDKPYQQECIKLLLDFLIKSGYDQPISPKSLTRPSGKDFSNIITFMLRKIDPNFQDGTLKMEDEISMNFKAMGYPFTVSKTALVAAGSPHTWPTLLAALVWLMERIQTLESIKLVGSTEAEDPGHFESLEELENKTDKVFFQYLGKAYTAFLRGDEQMTEQLENALADRFERDDAIIEQEIEQMTDKNAVMVERINNLAHGEQDLEEYTKKRDGYATDLEQFHDLIQQMDSHVAALEQKKKERAQELELTNAKLQKVNAHVQDLKEAVASQDLSVEDVQKISSEIKGLEEAFDRAHDLKEHRRQALWDTESQLDKFWNDLESLVSEYNAQEEELSLLPLVSLKTMKANLQKDETNNILGVDLVQQVQPALIHAKLDYSQQLSESKWKYQEALDHLESSEEAFTTAHETLKILDQKIETAEDTIDAEKLSLEKKLEVRTREAESMEQRVAALRDPVALEEQMASFERQCAELESLRLKYEEENVAKKRAVMQEIDQACQAIQDYDAYCQQKIAQVLEYKEEKQSARGKLRMPEDLISSSS